MSFEQLLLRAGLLVILAISAAQDLRGREVSNWITIPLFLVGLAGCLTSGKLAVIVAMIAIVTVTRSGYGPADAKILVGLTGLWPASVLPCLLLMLAFSAAWQKYRTGSLAPMVVPMLAGVAMTAILEIRFI
jgi:Flp pilus assembly protein protease CpaA